MKKSEKMMRAAVAPAYGPPDVFQIKEVPIPTIGEKDVLIQVRASAVNSADWRLRKPDPWGVRLFLGLFRPRIPVMGGVFSGTVIQTGSKVSRFKVGDNIFGSCGMRLGAYGEQLCLPEKSVTTKMPAKADFKQAAALTFGYLTALHYLQKAGVSEGQKVLVYGASGSVGTAVVQLARHFGAQVTAVCSAGNFSLMKQIGADDVLDYSSPEFANHREKYDIVVDTVGKTPWRSHLARVSDKGKLILIAAGALRSMYLPVLQPFFRQTIIAGVASEKQADLELLANLAQRGIITPVIDRVYKLEEIATAHEYVEQGHKKGNVVIELG